MKICKYIALCIFVVLMSFLNTSAAAEIDSMDLLFGPVTVLRETGQPNEVTYEFARPSEFSGPFRLIITNGDDEGHFRVSSALILLNGNPVLSPSDLNQRVGEISREVGLSENNTLTIRLQSAPGAFLKISIAGKRLINPLDQFLEETDLKLVGVSANNFNNLSAPLQFSLSGTEFLQDLSEVKLTINGNPVSDTKLAVEPNLITATSVLVEGKNNISLSAVDVIGRPLYFSATLWAGSRTLTVDIVNQYGVKILDPVQICARLSDDQSVCAQISTSSGTAVFQNLPGRTILIQATSTENRLGYIGVIGSQGYARVPITGFNAPSPIENNDFGLGTQGWNIGTAPVTIVPHNEGIPGQSTMALTKDAGDEMPPSGRRDQEPPMPVAEPQSPNLETEATTNALADNDLVLRTSGEGERSISRTFYTALGTTAVRIRYRFITSEVPYGYFGSKYNDYFRVSLRSQLAGKSAGESNSMNGLGLAAFDYASGATKWRNVTLQVNPKGDVIQADVGVANVGDGLYDSSVVVDFIEEVKDQVRPSITWNSTQGGIDLSYQVVNGSLSQDTEIRVCWANGTGCQNIIGQPFFTYNVPAGTAEGQHGPIHISGNSLNGDPAGTTHLIAASSETSLGSLADVRVNFGANANAAAVWATTLDIIKDGLRASGQPAATITSTTRSPADQARAMFQNLVNQAHSISDNVANQHALYGPAGDAVIDVFEQQIAGLNYQQVIERQGTIRAAMEREIITQGPGNISRHCADPAQRNVVDVGSGVFNANNVRLFIDAVRGRVNRFLDERNSNGCFHIEII